VTQFVAIVDHADEPGVLDACIRHHMAIGVERLFVCLQNEDRISAAKLRGDERVAACPVSDLAGDDRFLYLGEALRAFSDQVAL
jgi:hypothetical protein